VGGAVEVIAFLVGLTVFRGGSVVASDRDARLANMSSWVISRHSSSSSGSHSSLCSPPSRLWFCSGLARLVGAVEAITFLGLTVFSGGSVVASDCVARLAKMSSWVIS